MKRRKIRMEWLALGCQEIKILFNARWFTSLCMGGGVTFEQPFLSNIFERDLLREALTHTFRPNSRPFEVCECVYAGHLAS